jgi:hypothetical protein
VCKGLFGWAGIKGETPLTALVKYWPEGKDEKIMSYMENELVRDGCKGFAALANAAYRGLRCAVSSLLKERLQ